MGKKKKKSNKIKKLSKIFKIFSFLLFVIFIGLCAFNSYVDIMSKDANASQENENKLNFSITKKKIINALVCGMNDNLTDTMIYVKYNVETGNIAMMSIPRDTYVENEYCIGHKLNAIYRGKNIEPLVSEIEELLDVEIDYYLVFDRDMLISMVDAIGGVEIDVEMRMKYDDPTQDLHIDLQPGLQTLTGEQAEQYVRFRHNNDMTVGYAMGDLDRTKVQQNFIKAFIKQTLDLKNVTKLKELASIAMDNTDTNVTLREILKYTTDVSKIDVDNIYSCTAEGAADMIDGLSYFLLDKEATKEVLNTKFDGQSEVKTESVQDTTEQTDLTQDEDI